MIVNLELPKIVQPLFEPKRYKILHGGRGSGKSWSVARALLIIGAQKKLRILCAREFQNSIADSVHKLLADQIRDNNLEEFYEIQKTTILGKNGTEFLFEGLKHNIQSIKSKEAIDIVWIEEAQTVSKSSWDILVPTIRQEGSEIWITFNPELETDETYQRFILNPPAESILLEMNYTENPWFPDVLEIERLDLKAKDPDAYMNVWEGKCRQALEGAVYANELRDAEANKRITNVPYDPSTVVHTFWDLGYSDTNAIWFVQKVGMEYRVIDYYENNFQSIQHYLKVLDEKKYLYGYDVLPHDAKHKQLSAGGVSIMDQMIQLGRKVVIAPNLKIIDGISAVRTMFSQCYFDRNKCQDGINALRRYRYDINNKDVMSRTPIHDGASHAADSFRYFAVGYKYINNQDKQSPKPNNNKRWSKGMGY